MKGLGGVLHLRVVLLSVVKIILKKIQYQLSFLILWVNHRKGCMGEEGIVCTGERHYTYPCW